jgi:hypothetical protein
MPLSSMTGFARSSGEHQGLYWQWEIKSVNGKALDVRLRLPQGFEALETPVRSALAQAFRRGNLQVSLSVSGAVQRETVRLNQEILDRLVEAGEALRGRIGGEPLRADALLAIRGVVEVTSLPEEEDQIERRHAAMLEKLGAQEGRIEASFSFFIRKRAPVSGLQSLLDYQGRWIAETRAGATTLWMEVGVPVKTLCPCSKEISDYGAHNQRSLVTLRVELVAPVRSRVSESTVPTLPPICTVGRQPASACGTFSSTARSCARAACRVGLLA